MISGLFFRAGVLSNNTIKMATLEEKFQTLLPGAICSREKNRFKKIETIENTNASPLIGTNAFDGDNKNRLPTAERSKVSGVTVSKFVTLAVNSTRI